MDWTAIVRKLRPWVVRWWWAAMITTLALLTLLLGMLGFHRNAAAQGQSATLLDVAYLSLQLFILDSGAVSGPVGADLQIARFLAPLVAGYAAIHAVLGLFFHHVQTVLPRFMRGHYVVCGLGRKGSRLVAQLVARGERVVVIEHDQDNEELTDCRQLGAVVLLGRANDRRVLARACVHRAKTLIAITGDDAINVETAVLAHELNICRRGQPLRCVVHVSDPGLTEMLRKQSIYIDQTDPFDLEFFNAFRCGAAAMLAAGPALDRRQAADDWTPHLLIVGLGRLGEALLVQAAARWKATGPDPGDRLRVVVVDKDASLHRQWIPLRYSDLDELAEVAFVEMDVRSPDFARGDFLAGLDLPRRVDVAYLCLDNDSLGMTAALALRECPRCAGVPIVVRMSQQAGLATLFRPGPNGQGAIPGVRVVGMLEVTCTLELVLGEG
jgi:hypothetical protein